MEEQPLIPYPEQDPNEHTTDNPELLGDLLVRHSLERPAGTQPIKRAETDTMPRTEAAYEKRPEATETVMGRVAEAAEQEEPIERQLELRHEIKDTDKTQVSPLFAQKAPVVSAPRTDPSQYPPVAIPISHDNEQDHKVSILTEYRQPIRLGFYLGIALTLSFILFLVLQ